MGDYFTKDTDKAIVDFNKSSDPQERQELFDKKIRPAFEKLIESLIYVYGFFRIDNVDTLKKEALTNLYEMLNKFDPEKGAKGFSYFNVIAKNWFIQKDRDRKKKAKNESELFLDLDHENVKNDPNLLVNHFESQLEEKEQWVQFYEEMDSWRDELTKKTERAVLEAVIFLMKNHHHVNIYNKKAVYLYLRELTGLNTKQVVINLKKIKGLYLEWKNKYLETGES